jgi:transcriptional regulator with XRE-family HTH domain
LDFNKLEARIKESGLSLRELSKRVGMSYPGLRYSIKNRSLRIDSLEEISKALKVDPSDFLEGASKPQKEEKEKKAEGYNRASSISDRLMELINEKAGGSFSKFGEAIGESRFRLSQIVNKGTSFQVDILEKIMKVYPETDLYWLVTGKGRYRDRVLRELEAIKKRLDGLEGD